MDGGANVLAHVALAWSLNKPLVLLAPNGSVLEHLVGEKIDETRMDMILTADTAERAMDMLMEKVSSQSKG